MRSLGDSASTKGGVIYVVDRNSRTFPLAFPRRGQFGDNVFFALAVSLKTTTPGGGFIVPPTRRRE